MTGKSKIFKLLYLLVCIIGTTTHVNSQTNLEAKALTYFCENINSIEQKLVDYNIRFSNQTTGKTSSVYNIANCLGDIDLLTNRIPNEAELDSLTAINDTKNAGIITIHPSPNCTFLKRHVFAPFNKRVYRLKLYNAVAYHGKYYVEIFLTNKNLNTWIVCVEFNQAKEIINHCVSSTIY